MPPRVDVAFEDGPEAAETEPSSSLGDVSSDGTGKDSTGREQEMAMHPQSSGTEDDSQNEAVEEAYRDSNITQSQR